MKMAKWSWLCIRIKQVQGAVAGVKVERILIENYFLSG
jgi:hypothetical protein